MLHLHLYLSKRWWLLSLRSTADGVRPRHQLVDGAKLRASVRASGQGRVRTASERGALRRWKAKRGSPRGSRTDVQVRSAIPRNFVCGMFRFKVTRNLFPVSLG